MSGQVDWGRGVDFHLTTPFPGWFGGLTSTMAGLRAVWEAEHGPGSVIGLAPSAAAAEVLGARVGPRLGRVVDPLAHRRGHQVGLVLIPPVDGSPRHLGFRSDTLHRHAGVAHVDDLA